MKLKPLICVLLLICACLCSCSNVQGNTDILFYYPNKQINYSTTDQIIGYEKCVENVDPLAYSELLTIYLKGPRSSELNSPFPSGTALVRFTIDQQIAHVTLSNDFSELTGVDLSIACACLSLTIEKISGCAQVQISAENAQLDNREFITVNTNEILLIDELSQ